MEWFVSRFNRLAFETLNEYSQLKAQPITLIYGPSGVGKSELLKMVYQKIKNPQVLFLNAQIFSQSYAFAAQNHTLSEFRSRIRSHELLILDQLERLAGKTHTLEELLHTLDALANKSAKVIIGFQGDLQSASFLTERLYSRLFGGLTLPILAPTLPELEEFTNRYARSRFLVIQEDILARIAAQAGNLSKVQRLVNGFAEFAKDSSKVLSNECWEEYLELERERNRLELTPDNVIRKINEMTGISAQEIKGSSRRPSTAAVRKFAVYSIRELCVLSYPQLGAYFQRAHSVMMKSYQQFEDMKKENKEWEIKYEILQAYFSKS